MKAARERDHPAAPALPMSESFTDRKNELLRRGVTVEVLLPGSVTLKDEGKVRAVNPCPLCSHRDCFRIYGPDDWHCYSEDHSGDIVKFWQRLHDFCTPGDALQDLERRHGCTSPESGGKSQSKLPRKPTGPKPMTEKRWRGALSRMEHPGPYHAWLARHRISEDAWHGLVGFESEHYDSRDRTRPALLYPQLSQEGTPLGPYAVRFLDGRQPKTKTKISSFLLGAHLVPDSPGTIVVCAGDKDFLVARTLGFLAVGLLGECTWPKGATEALRGRRVALALDADEAGYGATAKHLTALQQAGIDVRWIDWPREWLANGEKDVADFYLAGRTREDFERLILSAKTGLPVIVSKSPTRPKATVRAPGTGYDLNSFALDMAKAIAPLEEWFLRGDEVVVVRRTREKHDKEPRLRFVPVGAALARADAGRFVTFYVLKGQNKRVPTPVAEEKFRAVLLHEDFRQALPPVERVFNCPMPYFSGDGTLGATEAGYKREVRAITNCAFGLDLMSPMDAADVLAEHLLGDFCFADKEIDLANTLALLLTPMVSALTPMRTPAFLVNGNRNGVGKTLLASLAGLILDGVPPPISPPTDREELRKQLTSMLRAGTRLCVFDNLRGHLSSPALEAFLTTPVWQDRILGKSEMVILRNDLLVILTSNGLSGTGDLARRVVWICLEYNEEHIRARKFRYPEGLDTHILAHRRRYVSALASLIKAWADEGQPKGDVTMPTFDTWAKTIGGILKVATIKGFLGAQDQRSGELDTETAEVKALVEAWAAKYNGKAVTTRDLHELAREHDLFPWIGEAETKRLAKLLGRYRNRVFGGWRIIEPQKMRPIRYSLRRLE